MADEHPILLERQGDVAWLKLNIPQRLNPLAQGLQVTLRAQLAALREDRSVRALVITGVVGSLWMYPLMSLTHSAIDFLLTPLRALLF